MKTYSIDEIERQAMQMLKKIPNYQEINFFISFRQNTYDCMPFVEIDKNGYHIKCYERGKLIQDRVTSDAEELFYWIFKDITFEAGCKYELKNRIKYQDHRRLVFSKQLELLKYINEDFMNRCEEDIKDILQKNPYKDNYLSIFDLIDDFEKIAKTLQEILHNQSSALNVSESKAKDIINKINQLHKHGTSDILKFCIEISEDIKMIHSELKRDSEQSTEILLQITIIEQKLTVAQKIFASLVY